MQNIILHHFSILQIPAYYLNYAHCYGHSNSRNSVQDKGEGFFLLMNNSCGFSGGEKEKFHMTLCSHVKKIKKPFVFLHPSSSGLPKLY